MEYKEAIEVLEGVKEELQLIEKVRIPLVDGEIEAIDTAIEAMDRLIGLEK